MNTLIGITGPSCAGKTTVCNALKPELGAEHVSLDDFFVEREEYPRRGRWKIFDSPRSIRMDEFVSALNQLKNGGGVTIPRYDKDKLTVVGQRAVEPSDVVLADGFLLLHDQRVRRLLDFAVFLDIPVDEQRRRRLEAYDYYPEYFDEVVEPAFREYVEPMKTHADVVVDANASKEDVIEEVLDSVERIL